MKIDKLHIRSRFKNLENVTIDFDEDKLMTVIVGGNGSGKSNVLEALASIFEKLDLGLAAPFSYQITYVLGIGDNARRIWSMRKGVATGIDEKTGAEQVGLS